MTTAIEALRELIRSLEDHYAPADSIYEAYFGNERVEKALDSAYAVLDSQEPRKNGD